MSKSFALRCAGLTAAIGMSCPALAELTWDIELGAGGGYDSNVTVDEIDLTSAVGDQFFALNASLSATYLVEQAHTFTASYSISDKNYRDLDRFELRNQLASLGYRFKHNDVTYGVNYRVVDAELGGNGFLALQQFAPYVSGFLSDKQFLRVGYTACLVPILRAVAVMILIACRGSSSGS